MCHVSEQGRTKDIGQHGVSCCSREQDACPLCDAIDPIIPKCLARLFLSLSLSRLSFRLLFAFRHAKYEEENGQPGACPADRTKGRVCVFVLKELYVDLSTICRTSVSSSLPVQLVRLLGQLYLRCSQRSNRCDRSSPARSSFINSIRVAGAESVVRAQTNRSTPVIWTTLGAVRAIATDLCLCLCRARDITLNAERDPCSFFCLLSLSPA